MSTIKRALQWVGGVATALFIIGVFTLTGVLISAAYIIGVLAFMGALMYLACAEALSLLSPERSDGEREGERVDLSGMIDVLNKQRKERDDNPDNNEQL